MFVSNALIGLREGLEAALVVVILLAFLKKTNRTWGIPYVWVGVGTAVALSVALGAVLTYGTRQLTFETQDHVTGCPEIGLPLASSTVAETVMLTLHFRVPLGRDTVTLLATSPAYPSAVPAASTASVRAASAVMRVTCPSDAAS